MCIKIKYLPISIILLLNLTSLASAGTLGEQCSEPALTIPNNDPQGVSDTLTINEMGQVKDLKVVLNIEHEHVGELIVKLKHLDTAQSITLLDQPGIPTSLVGCTGKNLEELTLADSAGSRTVEDDCDATEPAYAPKLPYQPSESLSNFVNAEIQGEWVLTVSDNNVFNEHEGTLTKWCLKYERTSQAGFTPDPAPDTTLNFGQSFWGQAPTPYNFTFKESGGSEALVIYSGSITDPHPDDFSWVTPASSDDFPIIIKIGDSYTFEIACNPILPGIREALLTLTTNVEAMPVLTYPLSCEGVAASYTASLSAGGTLDFGDSDVGVATASKSFEIQETQGGVDLTIKSADFIGGEKDDFSWVDPTSFPHTITKGSSKDFALQCTPKAGGSRQTTLELTTNDPRQPTIKYQLKCKGNAPVLESEPIAPGDNFNFGTSRSSESVPQAFTLNNSGYSALEISAIEVTGGGMAAFTVFPLSLTIDAGSSDTFTVTCQPPTENETYNASLELTTNDPSQPNPLIYLLSCTGSDKKEPLFDSTPLKPGDTLKFGRKPVGKSAKKSFYLQELGNADLIIDAMDIEGDPDFTVLSPQTPVTIADGDDPLKITLQCKPSEGGARSATLNIISNHENNTAYTHQYTLECDGKVADFALTPVTSGDTIEVGHQAIGRSITKSIEIEETGEVELQIDLAAEPITGEHAKEFRVDASQFPVKIKNGGEAQVFGVTCAPLGLGKRTASLHLTSNVPSKPTPTYTLTCDGEESLEAGYASTPVSPGQTIDFGSTPIDVPSEYAFNIKEIGSVVLAVDLATPVISGAHASEFSVDESLFPLFIPDKGEEKMVSLHCNPTKTGKRTATLHLTSSDPLNPTPSYSLECTGTPALIPVYQSTPAPDATLDFGQTTVGQAITQTIEITENGNTELTIETATPIFSGTHAQDFQLVNSPFPLTLADGEAAQTITIQCQPSAAGERVATLTLQTNAPNYSQPTYSLACTGEAVAEEPSVEEPSPVPPPSTPSQPSTPTKPSTPSTPVTDTTQELTVAITGNGEVSSEPDSSTDIQCQDKSAPCVFEYPLDTPITLTAKPAEGWQFEGWQGDCNEQGQVKSTISTSQQCQAIFRPITLPQISVTLTKTGAGTITSQPAGINCGEFCQSDFDQQQIVTLTATPASDTLFTGWSGDCVGNQSPLVINLDQAKTCQAQFDPKPTPPVASNSTLTVEIIGKGYVTSTPTGIDCDATCDAEFLVNTLVTLSAEPAPSYQFHSFTETCFEAGLLDPQTASLNMTAENKQCTVTFTPDILNAGILSLTQTELTLDADTKGFTLTVARSEGNEGMVAVDYYATELDGTPLTGPETCTGTLTWKNGEQVEKMILLEINPAQQQISSPPRQLLIHLTNVKGGATLGASTATVTLKTPTSPEDNQETVTEETPVEEAGETEEAENNLGPDNLQPSEENEENEENGAEENQENQENQETPETETTPDVFSCAITGTINHVCNFGGQTLTDITVSEQGRISNIELAGNIKNQGWIANATLEIGSEISGGILTGYFDNQGTLRDIDFLGAKLCGGALAGEIRNLSDGVICDVYLTADTQVSNGKWAGKIRGNPEAPARLDDLTLMAGSYITHVIIGNNVVLSPGVNYGPGVQFIEPPADLPRMVIDENIDAYEQTLTDVTINAGNHISKVVLEGQIDNQGEVSYSTLLPQSQLTGGILSGEFTNLGTIIDTAFTGSLLTGGELAGEIMLASKSMIGNVKLAPNAQIEGGQLQGPIIGDSSEPARLIALTVRPDSYLANLILVDTVVARDVTLENVSLGPKTKVTKAKLQGTINNQGRLSQATVQKNAHLIGGTLLKTIHNHGTIEDAELRRSEIIGGILAGDLQATAHSLIKNVTFAPNARLEGGVLIGEIEGDRQQPPHLYGVSPAPNSRLNHVILDGPEIFNQGTLSNIEFRGNSLHGGVLAKRIKVTMGGTIADVQLAPDAVLDGGNLQGNISGDPTAPALLKNVFITANTVLENVILDDSVTIAPGVIFGEGVQDSQGNQLTESDFQNSTPTDEEPLTALAVDKTGQITENEATFQSEIHANGSIYPNHAMLTFAQAKSLTLAMTLIPALEDIDQLAELIIVAQHQDQAREANWQRQMDQWLTWDKDIPSLTTAQSQFQLPDSFSLDIYQGDLTDIAAPYFIISNGHRIELVDLAVAGEYIFYLGYRLSNSTIVFNGIEPLHFYVERAPASCILYAVHDKGLHDTQFITIDLSKGLTGEMLALGPLYPGHDIEGLAQHPLDRNLLYAAAGDHAEVNGEIRDGHVYTVHRETGELTLIGDTGFDKVAALAFNANDFTLWAWARNEITASQPNEPSHPQWTGLIKINPNTGEGTPMKQFDYQHDMGGLAWNFAGNKLYASSDDTLWVYDLATQTLETACTNIADGRIEALDTQPNDFLLMSVDSPNSKETKILAYDPVNCQIVHERHYQGLRYDDIESIVWPASECNDLSWLSDNH